MEVSYNLISNLLIKEANQFVIDLPIKKIHSIDLDYE